MPKARGKGGFVSGTYDPLCVPNAPTDVEGSEGDGEVEVSFTAPSDEGCSSVTGYGVKASDGTTATGSSSPITVTGLTNGTSYTFNVWAINAYGPSPYSDASGSVTPSLLERAIFAGGTISGNTCGNTLDYVEIGTLGNATDFGNLSANRGVMSGVSGAQYAYICGGQGSLASGTSPVSNIYKITVATTGNSVNSGSLTVARAQLAACGNTTRSVVMGGFNDSSSTGYRTMDYFNPTSGGNATLFGNLSSTSDNIRLGAGFASPTRGLFAGGASTTGSAKNIIQYITIASTGNSSDFGDLTQANMRTSGCASSTRGIILLNSNTNRIDYVTIASTGNASDFGDLYNTYSNQASTVSSNTRGLVAMGSTDQNTIQYFTIATLGNASDFGDLTVPRWRGAGISNAHGGLQ